MEHAIHILQMELQRLIYKKQRVPLDSLKVFYINQIEEVEKAIEALGSNTTLNQT